MKPSQDEIDAGAAAICDCAYANCAQAGRCGVCKYAARTVLEAVAELDKTRKAARKKKYERV